MDEQERLGADRRRELALTRWKSSCLFFLLVEFGYTSGTFAVVHAVAVGAEWSGGAAFGAAMIAATTVFAVLEFVGDAVIARTTPHPDEPRCP